MTSGAEVAALAVTMTGSVTLTGSEVKATAGRVSRAATDTAATTAGGTVTGGTRTTGTTAVTGVGMSATAVTVAVRAIIVTGAGTPGRADTSSTRNCDDLFSLHIFASRRYFDHQMVRD